MNELILEPLKYYNDYAKEKHKANLTEHFDELVTKSGINVEENRATVKRYKEQLEKIKAIDKKIKRYKTLRVLLIILASLSLFWLIIGGFLIASSGPVGLVICFFSLVFGVGSLLLIFLLINKRIKKQNELRAKESELAFEIRSEAERQMAPLNALFNDKITHTLIEKTMPELKIHDTYTQEHQNLLIDEYDYIDLTDDETSVIDAISGTLFDNPYLYERYVSHMMGTEIYHGSLLIRWTETRRDSNGKIRRVTRTQTLHASVTKPKPEYHTLTHLGYGSQAAPNLSFSRTESDTDELSERALRRRIKAGERKLEKREERAISNDDNFQAMTNSEFDVLFGAHNRTNEVEFRLMYTPLAQNNTVDLLRSKDGYGDDFNIIKQGRYNIVKSNHAQVWDMSTDPQKYRSYDVDLSRKLFLSVNEEYFKSVFFDFAPLMAVPAYQDEPVASMRKVNYDTNFTQYEHEVLANTIGESAFAHPNARTRSILKTTASKSGSSDRVMVTAHSYTTAERVEFVSTLGGDGRFHLVPVRWVEYIPVSNTSVMTVSKERFGNGGVYKHGLYASVLN